MNISHLSQKDLYIKKSRLPFFFHVFFSAAMESCSHEASSLGVEFRKYDRYSTLSARE